MEITGIIKLKNAVQQVSEKFKKLEFVLSTQEQYPQHILIQLTQDRCALIDKYNEGDEIKCQINLKGREWTNPQGEVKYFNSIEAWKIEGVKWSETERTAAPTQATAYTPVQKDDLPF